jgi:endogenous inhibitor of DNA gyrase (YacG/DUF329 family)
MIRSVSRDTSMELKFECPTCGQHLSATLAQIGGTAPCPNCNSAVTVPDASTLPAPPLASPLPPPPIPPQPTPQPPPAPSSAPPSPSREISTHILKKKVGCIGSIVAIAIVALVIWFAYNSSKPKLFAKVEVTSQAVRITNGNDTAWDSPTIILNDGFAGPILVLAGPWARNETRELSLGDFEGRFNHQPFKAGYEKVRQVTIQARGFQLGIYETR